MATVILCLMGVWDMDTVMETTATVMSPNMDMIMGIHTEDMAIRMTIPTATVRPQVISLICVLYVSVLMHQMCYLVSSCCGKILEAVLMHRDGVWYSMIHF